MPKQFPLEVRDRAIRMVLDRPDNYPSVSAACNDLGPKLNIGAETLRRWVMQARADAGVAFGPTTSELEEIKALKRKVRDLEETNEILKAASIFFARELDPRHRS
jgi:transposase